MHFSTIFAISTSLLLTVTAAPAAESVASCPPLRSITKTVTKTVSSAHSSTTAAALHSPTAPYTVISARSGSPIHLQPLNAAGQSFYLGGSAATYCPLTNQTQCPPGKATAFLGLGALDTEVPGGQLVYVAPDGHLGFTQAHSATYPPGAILGALNYTKSPPTASFGDLGTGAFGATGFMACPPKKNSTQVLWQVFAALQNATVPTGNVTDCLGFDALTSDYPSTLAAAWEYT